MEECAGWPLTSGARGVGGSCVTAPGGGTVILLLPRLVMVGRRAEG